MVMLWSERKGGSVRVERGHFMTRGPHLLGAVGNHRGRTCIFHTRYRMQLPSLLSRTLLSLSPGPKSAAHGAPGEAGEGLWRDILAQGLSLHSQTPTPAKPGSVCPPSPGTEHPKSPESRPQRALLAPAPPSEVMGNDSSCQAWLLCTTSSFLTSLSTTEEK